MYTLLQYTKELGICIELCSIKSTTLALDSITNAPINENSLRIKSSSPFALGIITKGLLSKMSHAQQAVLAHESITRSSVIGRLGYRK